MTAELPSPDPTQPATVPAPQPSAPPRVKGKIAHMPKEVRDRINGMLREGLTYSEIIESTREVAPDLNQANLSLWYNGPHQDWLKRQETLEAERAKWEFTADLVAEPETSNITQATAQLAAKQIYNALNDLSQASVGGILTAKPEEYVRLINAISRLSRDSLSFQKYRDACLQARVEVAKLRNPAREFTEAETRAVVDRLDHILGFK